MRYFAFPRAMLLGLACSLILRVVPAAAQISPMSLLGRTPTAVVTPTLPASVLHGGELIAGVHQLVTFHARGENGLSLVVNVHPASRPGYNSYFATIIGAEQTLPWVKEVRLYTVVANGSVSVPVGTWTRDSLGSGISVDLGERPYTALVTAYLELWTSRDRRETTSQSMTVHIPAFEWTAE